MVNVEMRMSREKEKGTKSELTSDLSKKKMKESKNGGVQGIKKIKLESQLKKKRAMMFILIMKNSTKNK